MAYLVIARKWRPQTFDEVVGQPHVVKILRNAIEANRIAHAYLFSGARGVGKTSVARILAKTVNCKERTKSNPCNKCTSCTSITNGSSVDVLEIDAASNRGIDEIRELRESVRYLPAVSNYKVYIIDEVHMLTGPAFNALLKTLEEPPGHVIFVLATTSPHKIPITILSRCQRFDFRRIPLAEITAHLKKIVEAENLSISEGVLSVIAREADGSMRDAQSLLEQVLTFIAGGGSDKDVLELLGIVDQGLVQEAADAVIDQDVLRTIRIVDAVYNRGYNAERFCQELAIYFRNLLLLKISKDDGKQLIDLPESVLGDLGKRVDKITAENLHFYCHFLMKGINDLKYSSLPKLSLEMLLVQLCKIPTLHSIPSIISKIKELETRLISHTKGVSSSRAEEPSMKALQDSPVISEQLQEPLQEVPAVSDIQDKELPKTWEGFLSFLRRKKKRFLADILYSGRLLLFSDSEIRLELNSGLNLIDDNTKKTINSLAKEFFGKDVQIVLSGNKSENGANLVAAKREKKKLYNEAKSSGPVSLVLDILGGTIIDVKKDEQEEEGLSLEENGLE
ncbi:MAG TPA: DNA polymerase III subunit gamma/tau [Deltaproteobacteria bacterium]|nr:DNA polymerase III subunit gamma/tau [Deltaproteobacteria bacterium]